MKAVIKASSKAGSIKTIETDIPTITEEEVLVQVHASSICYSDCSILNNTYIGRKSVPIPLIMGHEGAGTIVAVGKEVTSCTIGERVVLEPIAGCGTCIACKKGLQNLCSAWSHIGMTRAGTFAEFIAVPAYQTHTIPDNIAFDEASLIEPLGLAMRTLEQSRPLVGDTVVIVGPGSLGMMHLLAFKASGVAKVIMIGTEKDKQRLNIAKQLGADETIDLTEQDPVEAVFEYSNGLGGDIIVETANSPKASELCFDLTAIRSKIVLFGLYATATFKPVNMLRNCVTVFGDAGTSPRHFFRAINWINSGKVPIKKLIGARFSLDEAEAAFETARDGKTIKTVFEIA